MISIYIDIFYAVKLSIAQSLYNNTSIVRDVVNNMHNL